MYKIFLEWCENLGLEFPCTADEFHARAVYFARAKGAEGANLDWLVDALCKQGIGQDWKQQD